MSKFRIIVSHTYMTRVKTKAFLISTSIILLFMIGMGNIQSLISLFSSEDLDEIAVIDESNTLTSALKEGNQNSSSDFEFVIYEGVKEEAKNAVQEDDYQALIILSLNKDDLPEASYYASNVTESGMQIEVEQQLQQLKVVMATEKAGIDQAILTDIYEPVIFNTTSLDESAKTSEERNQARGIVYIMLFLLYMAVIMYGQMIATDVATEKSSRVMELLVSSAPPVTHMFAKITGIALLGLTQVVLFVGVGYMVISSKQNELTGGIFEIFGIQDTSPTIYLYAVVFFLLGYFLYATLAAMLGSLVSRVEDVNQLMLPMILLIVVAFLIAMFGIGMPESKLVTIASHIPFFAPMVMFLRVGMINVPVWEIALSIGMLVGTIVLLGILGARVYKGGVLMYGRSSSLKDFKKAIALSKKN